MKAQAEVVVIFTIILISAAVILYSFNPPKKGGAKKEVVEESKTIVDSIKNVLEDISAAALESAYDNQGGENLSFYGKRLSVWRDCKNSWKSKGDVLELIKDRVAKGVESEIKEKMKFFGKVVVFKKDELSVGVSTSKNRVNVAIRLPTYVEGINVKNDYTISLNSMLADVLRVTEKLKKDVEEKRFENAIMLGMLASNYSSTPLFPYSSLYFKCSELSPVNETLALKDIVKRVNSAFFEDETGLLTEIIAGENMNVSCSHQSDFMEIPSTCMGVINVSCSMKIPLAVFIYDPLLHRFFKLSFFANVNDNLPECPEETPGVADGTEKSCEGDCRADIVIKDEDGNYVDGADVFFGGCFVGRSKGGRVSSPIPCYASLLNVYHENYGGFSTFRYSEDLKNLVITLKKKASGKFIFMGVPMVKTASGYEVSGNGKPLEDMGNYKIIVNAESWYEERVFFNPSFKSTVFYNLFPDDYLITVHAFNSDTGSVDGYVSGEFFIKGGNIYVYVPIVEGGIEERDFPEINEAMKRCGFKLISEKGVDGTC